MGQLGRRFAEAAPMIAAATMEQLSGKSEADSKVPPVTTKKTRDPDVDMVEIVKRAVRSVAQERAKLLDLDTTSLSI